MRHLTRQRCAQLALYATLARCALACGADTDRGPPIGSPPGPDGPVIHEAGSTGVAGGQTSSNPNTGGSTAVELGGASSVDTGGSAFGAGGSPSAGRDPFGVGGSSTGPSPFGGSF
ncbi:MAG TPA: hypothetical protein VER96_25125 [Polyangiaceae bacterium]|nr:hypothetical protein [Polyangiaceae bacterium]